MHIDLPAHPASFDPDTLLKDCRVERTRASGPGGQHRNKVETAIRVTHTPTNILGQAAERRSQTDNKKKALFRLRANLAIDYRAPQLSAVRAALDLENDDFVQNLELTTSKLWRSRTGSRKISCNPSHADFPSLLAEALDVMFLTDYSPTLAARLLSVSTSQLIKFLKDEPRAFQSINSIRQKNNQHPLR